MKIKITLIVSKIQKGVPFNHPQFFQIYLTDDNQFLRGYMSTKDVNQTLSDLFSKHFHIDFDWMVTELSGFRKTSDREVESGNFLSSEDIKSQNIKIDLYYEKLLSERSRSY